MMIPAKEKAQELVNTFEYAKKYANSSNAMSKELAKECALISVNEILKSNPTFITCNTTELNYDYWINVKKEIEKL